MQTQRLAGRAIAGFRAVNSGFFLAFIAVFFWATTGPFIEVLGRDYHLQPLEISFWRTLFISAVLGLFVLWREGWAGFALNRKELILYGINGVVGIAIFNLAWSGSVQINGTAVATTLLYCAPAIVALGSQPLLGEKIVPAQIIAIAVNLAGVVLVSGAYNPSDLFRSPDGFLLGLASGATFALYALLGKLTARTGRRSTWSSLFYLFFFGFLALALWGIPFSGGRVLTPPLNFQGWGVLLALAFGPTLGGYAFFTFSLKFLPAAVAGLLTTLELPIAASLGLILFGKGLDLLQWCGAILILAGVVGLQIRNSRADRN